MFESVAKALIVNENDEALVLTLGEHKEQPEKSYLPDLPGGLVDPGETELDAVVREVREETGIDLSAETYQLVYAGTAYFDSANKSVTKSLYIAHINSTPNVTLSWEHSAYEWRPLHDVRSSIGFRPFYDEAIEYCFSNGILADSR